MAHLVDKTWTSFAQGMTRRDRRPCSYRAYVPDPIAGRDFILEGETAADVADAETALARFDARASSLADTEALARILLRAECVASSRIEGLVVGARRLLKAEAAVRAGDPVSDMTAQEVLGNVDAMALAMGLSGPGQDISVDSILAVHEALLRGTDAEPYAGRIRQEQNWIGGSSYNPCSASFVPPPPESVEGLLRDLCTFCNDDSLPAVVQAALAHAQFETIHPFVDGNGRAGRALIHMILRRRGLTARALPPVSLVLATFAQDYVDALGGTRYVGEPDSDEARRGADRWMALFAGACVRAVEDAGEYERGIADLKTSWRGRLGAMRADSSLGLLVEALPGLPLLTVSTAAELIGRSFRAVNPAVARLEDAGILRQTTVGRRNRAFEAPEVVDLFTALERQLASPERDTLTSPPARPVPDRRS